MYPITDVENLAAYRQISTMTLVDAGKACAAFHDENVRGVTASKVQCDEIWSFTYAKAKNVAKAKNAPEEAGDTWTWTALDSDTKLIISWLVGGRDGEYALAFMDDLRNRLANRVQLTTDGHKAYLEAVEEAFGADVDYAQLVKLYGEPENKGPERKYSPSVCTSAKKQHVMGSPDIEARQHLACRASEPDDAYAHAPLHPPDQRIQQEVRKPHAHGCALHRLVQFRAHPQDAQDYTGYGRWRD